MPSLGLYPRPVESEPPFSIMPSTLVFEKHRRHLKRGWSGSDEVETDPLIPERYGDYEFYFPYYFQAQLYLLVELHTSKVFHVLIFTMTSSRA